MEKLPLISVIVPVFRVEAYLDKCISSIVDQTYSNLEIILVDDGSPDRSGKICDAWAVKDRRIGVIHQENAGSGAARNAALKVAKGDLIAFVDSDDYLASDTFEHLYGLVAQGADIAECGHVEVFDDNASFDFGDVDVRSYMGWEAMAEHIRDRIFRQLIWNKLYRREIVGDIRFPIGKKIDDEFFTYQVLGNAKTLIRSEKICYAYRQQESSVMHSMGVQKRLQAVDAKVRRYAYIKKKFPELDELCLRDLWFTCIYQGQLALREVGKDEANQTIKYLRRVLGGHSCDLKDCTAKEMVWLSLARISLRGVCRLRNALKIGL
ncbi:MAG: glycosyltransferase [Lachnospiraceae bacterium]|nr:glycosyltransferase [Lachnospiraceae bacterium]